MVRKGGTAEVKKWKAKRREERSVCDHESEGGKDTTDMEEEGQGKERRMMRNEMERKAEKEEHKVKGSV